ncbi:hypothetical protein BH24ACI3_BH24ACI3_16210 [soil metagenome]
MAGLVKGTIMPTFRYEVPADDNIVDVVITGPRPMTGDWRAHATYRGMPIVVTSTESCEEALNLVKNEIERRQTTKEFQAAPTHR